MLSGRRIAFVIAGAVLLATTLVSVALRCFVRMKLVRRTGCDDALLIMAAVLNIAFFASGVAAVSYGFGSDPNTAVNTPNDRSKALLYWFTTQLLSIATLTIARLSIAATLLQIILAAKYRWTLYFVVSLSTLTGIGVFFFTIFRCYPVATYWNSESYRDSCASPKSSQVVWYLFSATAALSDLTLSFLPVFTISKLQMGGRTKLALAGILGFGCSATGAVIARIPLFTLYEESNSNFYAGALIEILTFVESSMVITAGGVMMIRPLLRILSRGRNTRGDNYEHCVS
ncbi:hypothetical protein BJX62DRAFT_238645 [Aspergillus germanicus]